MNPLPSTPENLRWAAAELGRGNPVVFPTETVYGIAANARDDEAVARVFSLKRRSDTQPLSVCYQSLEQASEDVFLNDFALLLGKHWLPGPITLLLRRRPESKISHICSAGQETLGIRIPNHPVALELLNLLPFPLTATSANLSGEASPKSATEVANALATNAMAIIDGGRCSVGVESTVLDLAGDVPRILRAGAVEASELMKKMQLKCF
ncbi:MAG: threonylcarbamoyl-AMP synthase [Holosporaceae bacterium]|jgi:L-threonylcarbamoyladenylate synthase|nr:threonylcarbamoyl-AMP synthase [Holosporaceae bacterium]